MSKTWLRRLIRAMQLGLIVYSGYLFALADLLDRGQGGYGDEEAVSAIISLLAASSLGGVAFAVSTRGRTFWRSARDLVVELGSVSLATGLIFLIVSAMSLGFFRFHFCSAPMQERHFQSMLPCHCGAECGG